MNAVCPNVIRTNISAPAFYDKLDGLKLLTPMQGLIEAFESMLGSNDTSGEIFEVQPLFSQSMMMVLCGILQLTWLFL